MWEKNHKMVIKRAGISRCIYEKEKASHSVFSIYHTKVLNANAKTNIQSVECIESINEIATRIYEPE